MEISGLKWYLYLVINRVKKALENLAENGEFLDVMVRYFEYFSFDTDVKSLNLKKVMEELGGLSEQEAAYLLKKCLTVLKMMDIAIPSNYMGSREIKAYLIPGIGYVSDEEWGSESRIYGTRSALIKSVIDRATKIGLSPFDEVNNQGYALNTNNPVIKYADVEDVEEKNSPEIRTGALEYVQGSSTKMDCIGLVSYLLQTPDIYGANYFDEYTKGSGALHAFTEIPENQRQPGDVVQFKSESPKLGIDWHVAVFMGPIGPISEAQDQILESAYKIGPRWATIQRLCNWIEESGQILSIRYFRKQR